MEESHGAVQLAHGRTTGAILDAFFEVHRELGHGFSEVVNRRALALVLRTAGLDAIEKFRLMSISEAR